MKRIATALSLAFCAAALIINAFHAREISALSEKTQAPRPHAAIAGFNAGKISNDLGGESGTWEKDPDDKAQWCRASLDNTVRRGGSGASLKLEYSLNSAKDASNGFWTQLNGLDASPYDHFEFWVKGDSRKGYPEKLKIEFKKIQKNAAGIDEAIKAHYIVEGITGDWQKISIPLNVMNGILDWRDMREFVITFEKKRLGAQEGALYLDDIGFTDTGDPGPRITDIVRHRKLKTDRWLGREEFAKFLIARLYGFPRTVFVKKEFPSDDRGFLLEIAKDTWRYFDEAVDREYNLPLDNIEFSENATVSDNTKVGDYTNITNIGLYLMCVISAYDFSFITREEAVKRINRTVDSVDKLEKFRDFPYNYYDITIFQRTSNFISYVDSGWLAAGLIVAANAFPDELADRCRKLVDSMDFSFFYDPVEGCMYHGFYTNIDYYAEYQYGAFYTEPRAVSFIAIGKGDVPREHWFAMARTFPESWLWQTQMPKGRREKTYLGCRTMGGYYEYDGFKFVPSCGGSMFEALMPALIIDEKNLAPKGLGINDEVHARLQARYAREHLKYPVFGMSPSCVPGRSYSEYGARPLGIKGYKDGVVTPHATFLAIEFIPDECIANLRTMLSNYEVYGEYGFYDSIDMSTGKVAIKYLCLDQAMTLIALNNYLNDGAVRKRFHSDKIAKNAEELLKVEDFFE